MVCDPRPYPEAVREVPTSFFKAVEMERIMKERLMGSGGNAEGEEPEAKRKKITVASAVAPEIDELNPLLVGRNSIEDRPISLLPDEYFGKFDAIVASRLSVDEAKRISVAVERYHAETTKKVGEENTEDKGNTLFILADTFGLDGCAHLDFGAGHMYRRELGKDKLSDPTKIEPYATLANMLSVPLAKATGRWDKTPPRVLVLQRLLMDYWNEKNKTTMSYLNEEKGKESFVTFAKQWMENNNIPSASLEIDGEPMSLEHLAGIAHHPEVSPVAAVLGGVLGNEVIKSLTRKGEPANNVLMFTGLDGGCRSFVLCPAEDK